MKLAWQEPQVVLVRHSWQLGINELQDMQVPESKKNPPPTLQERHCANELQLRHPGVVIPHETQLTPEEW